MLKILLASVRQGHQTIDYPEIDPTLPDRFPAFRSLTVPPALQAAGCARMFARPGARGRRKRLISGAACFAAPASGPVPRGRSVFRRTIA